MQVTIYECEFPGCTSYVEGVEQAEGWSQWGQDSRGQLATYCPIHSNIRASVRDFLAKHCTLNDDHDSTDCRKCAGMEDQLVLLVNGWLQCYGLLKR